jgi:hypothetical protein
VSGRLSSCFREGAPTGRFAPQFAVALRTLAAFLMELSKEHIEAGAKKSMEHFVGWRMFPSVSHRDGKIVAVSASNADHLREQIALVFRISYRTNEAILHHILTRIFERITKSRSFTVDRI